jgi:hypothetical protein
VVITISARSASSTPCPVTNRAQSSIKINVNVEARLMWRCTKSPLCRELDSGDYGERSLMWRGQPLPS